VDAMSACDDEQGSGFLWDDKRCVGEVARVIRIKSNSSLVGSAEE